MADKGDLGLILTCDDRGTPVIEKAVDRVKGKLAELSKAGQIAGSTFVDTSGKSNIATSAFAKFGNTIAQQGNKLSEMGGKLSQVGRQMTMTMALVAGGLIASTKSMISFGDSMWDMHQKTGLSTEVLSSFKLSAEKSGTSINGVAFALRYLSRSLQQAQKDGKAADKMFEGMGISTTDSSGKIRKLNDVFYDLADTFKNMDDGAEKTALAMRLFGRSGMELIPMLNLGSQGLKENAEMAAKLGLILTDKAAKACDEFNDKMAELKGASSGAFQTIASMALPTLQAFANAVVNIAIKIRKWADEHSVLAGILTKIGTVMVLVLSVLSPMILMIGKLVQMTGLAAKSIAGLAKGFNDITGFGTKVYKQILIQNYALNEETGRQILLTNIWKVSLTAVKATISTIALPLMIIAGVIALIGALAKAAEQAKKWKASWSEMMKSARDDVNLFYKSLAQDISGRIKESGKSFSAKEIGITQQWGQAVFKQYVGKQYGGDIKAAFEDFEKGAAKGKAGDYYLKIYANVKKLHEEQIKLAEQQAKLDAIMAVGETKKRVAFAETYGELVKQMKVLADAGVLAPNMAAIWIAAYNSIFGQIKKLGDEEKSAMASLGLVTAGEWGKSLEKLGTDIATAREQLLLSVPASRTYSVAIAEMREHIIKVCEVAIQQGIILGKTLDPAMRKAYETAKSFNAEFETMGKFKVESLGEIQGKIRGFADAVNEAGQRGVGLRKFIQQTRDAIISFGDEMARAGNTLPPTTQNIVNQARELKILEDQLTAVTNAQQDVEKTLVTMSKEYSAYNQKLVEDNEKTRISMLDQADTFDKSGNDLIRGWEKRAEASVEALSAEDALIAAEEKNMKDQIAAQESAIVKFQEQIQAKREAITEYYKMEQKKFDDLINQKKLEVELIRTTETTKAAIIKAAASGDAGAMQKAVDAGLAGLEALRSKGKAMITIAEAEAQGINTAFGVKMTDKMRSSLDSFVAKAIPAFTKFSTQVKEGLVDMGKTAETQAQKTAAKWEVALGVIGAALSSLGDNFKNQAADTYTEIQNIQTKANEQIAQSPTKLKDIQAAADIQIKQLYKQAARQEAAGTLAGGIGMAGKEVGGALAGWASKSPEEQAKFVKEKGYGKWGVVAQAVTPIAGSIGGALGQLISGKKSTYAGTGSEIGGALGGMLGPLGGLVGSLAGGLLGGLFGKKEKKTEEQRMAEEMASRTKSVMTLTKQFGAITDETAKKIAEESKKLGEAVAMHKNMADIIKDTGVTKKNVNKLWNESAAIFGDYAKGALTAAEATKSAGDSFAAMVIGAQELGTEGSAAMTNFIKDAKASGLKIKEVTDYINNQLGVVEKKSISAAEGLTLMAMAPNQTAESMKRLENQALATFNAMIENGATYSQAMESLGPALDAIIEANKKLGISGGAGIAKLLQIRSVTLANQDLFNAIEGNLGVMNALANSGALTQQILNDSANSANEYYKQLVNAGLSGDEALAQMVPTLERLRFLAKDHKLILDDTTKAMIKQAEEQGLLKDEEMSSNDIMLAGFGEIIKALGGDIPDAMKKAMDKMKKFGESGTDAAGEIKTSMLKTTDDIGAGMKALHDYVKNSDWNINSKWNVEGGPEGQGEGGGSGAGGGGGCFTAGTKVRMADGSYKNIEDVKVGDIVDSYDTDELMHVTAKVCEIFHHVSSDVSGVIMINGVLEATPDHLIYTYDEWTRAGDLKIGDMIMLFRDVSNIVEKLEWKAGWVETFNLHTDHETHNYFANDILVHNIKAQNEFFGKVRGDRQVFVAHRGENVEIYHPDKHTSADQIAGALADLVDVTKAGQQVIIEPVILEKRDQIIIEFIVKQIQSGNIKIPTTSIGG